MVITSMPKLSVIVPVYNTEKYLRECIVSILAQTFTDFELILVDDGSTDNSGAICDEYERSDTRIKVIHQANGGVTVARKHGLAASVGEYISFIDSDDTIEPNMYHDMLTEADIYNADIVYCDMVAETINGRILIPCSDIRGLFADGQLEQQIYSNMLFDFSKNEPGLSLSLCNKLIKSNILKSALAELPNDLTYGEDALGSLMCILRSTRIFIMENAPYYHYRQSDEFIERQHNLSLLPRLSILVINTQKQFLLHDFDGSDQLSAYTAKVSLYCIRQILIFNKEHSTRKKIKAIIDYFNEAHIHSLLEKAELLVKDKKLKKKIKLVNRKIFPILFLCFYAKEALIRAKRYLSYK